MPRQITPAGVRDSVGGSESRMETAALQVVNLVLVEHRSVDAIALTPIIYFQSVTVWLFGPILGLLVGFGGHLGTIWVQLS